MVFEWLRELLSGFNQKNYYRNIELFFILIEDAQHRGWLNPNAPRLSDLLIIKTLAKIATSYKQLGSEHGAESDYVFHKHMNKILPKVIKYVNMDRPEHVRGIAGSLIKLIGELSMELKKTISTDNGLGRAVNDLESGLNQIEEKKIARL